MTEFMCQYGNCTKTNTTIVVTDKSAIERPRFCCREHAAFYLLRKAWMDGGRRRDFAFRLADEMKTWTP